MWILIFVLFLIFAPGFLLWFPAAAIWLVKDGGFFAWMLAIAFVGGFVKAALDVYESGRADRRERRRQANARRRAMERRAALPRAS